MKIRSIFISVFSILFVSCSSSDIDSGSSAPEAALLIAPVNNSECTTGTAFSSSQSTVAFQWNTSENATGYFLYIKNLLTGTTMQYNAGAETSAEAVLLKGVPYSWYLSARNAAGDAVSSNIWKFYNASEGTINYAPFPAEAVSPEMSSVVYGNAVDLYWTGSDIDNDIVSYKIYLSTNPNPTVLAATTSENQVIGIQVSENTTYYWKITTTDSAGNSSNSDVFQFKVQ